MNINNCLLATKYKTITVNHRQSCLWVNQYKANCCLNKFFFLHCFLVTACPESIFLWGFCINRTDLGFSIIIGFLDDNTNLGYAFPQRIWCHFIVCQLRRVSCSGGKVYFFCNTMSISTLEDRGLLSVHLHERSTHPSSADKSCYVWEQNSFYRQSTHTTKVSCFLVILLCKYQTWESTGLCFSQIIIQRSPAIKGFFYIKNCIYLWNNI